MKYKKIQSDFIDMEFVYLGQQKAKPTRKRGDLAFIFIYNGDMEAEPIARPTKTR